MASSPRGALWLMRHVVLLTALPVLIRHMPLPALLKLLTPAKSQRSRSTGRLPDTDRIVAVTDGLLGRLGGTERGQCLRRSLALYHQLRRAGLPVELCLGVRRTRSDVALQTSEPPLAGHAWLAHGEKVLFEPASNLPLVYAETYRYPPPMREDATHSVSTGGSAAVR